MAMIDVSRDIGIVTKELTVTVISPMFLGGADGNAELKAAPFKASLRQWWRIVKGDLDWKELHKRGSLLFGSIDSDLVKDPQKGRIKIAVYTKDGSFFKIGKPEYSKNTINHPETKNLSNGTGYLGGMGIFDYKIGFKKTAILPNSQFIMKVSYPKENQEEIGTSLAYMNMFGSVGSRSRNGFGSFTLNPSEIIFPKIKNYEEVIKNSNKKYPHCFTGDTTGITFWQLNNGGTVEDVLHNLSDVYMKLRTHFKYYSSGDGDRNLLGAPVMKHDVRDWGHNHRMPSQLRLLIRPNNNNFFGLILHVAHPIAHDWSKVNTRKSQEDVWGEVYGFLDNYKVIENNIPSEILKRVPFPK